MPRLRCGKCAMPKSPEMVERVAAAIFDAALERTGRIWPRWTDSEGCADLRDDARALALAAIAALETPSGNMVDAGAASFGLPNSFSVSLPDVPNDLAEFAINALDGQPTRCWRAMIVSALNDE